MFLSCHTCVHLFVFFQPSWNRPLYIHIFVIFPSGTSRTEWTINMTSVTSKTGFQSPLILTYFNCTVVTVDYLWHPSFRSIFLRWRCQVNFVTLEFPNTIVFLSVFETKFVHSPRSLIKPFSAHLLLRLKDSNLVIHDTQSLTSSSSTSFQSLLISWVLSPVSEPLIHTIFHQLLCQTFSIHSSVGFMSCHSTFCSFLFQNYFYCRIIIPLKIRSHEYSWLLLERLFRNYWKLFCLSYFTSWSIHLKILIF